MYESRDEAFYTWFRSAAPERRGAKDAFDAGWKARKAASYRLGYNVADCKIGACFSCVNYAAEGTCVMYWIFENRDDNGDLLMLRPDDCTWIVPGTHPEDPLRRP